MSKTVEERRNEASELVQSVFVKVATEINKSVNAIEGFGDDEKFMTTQRIVNRIYVHYNKITFQVAEKVVQCGDLNEPV